MRWGGRRGSQQHRRCEGARWEINGVDVPVAIGADDDAMRGTVEEHVSDVGAEREGGRQRVTWRRAEREGTHRDTNDDEEEQEPHAAQGDAAAGGALRHHGHTIHPARVRGNGVVVVP